MMLNPIFIDDDYRSYHQRFFSGDIPQVNFLLSPQIIEKYENGERDNVYLQWLSLEDDNCTLSDNEKKEIIKKVGFFSKRMLEKCESWPNFLGCVHAFTINHIDSFNDAMLYLELHSRVYPHNSDSDAGFFNVLLSSPIMNGDVSNVYFSDIPSKTRVPHIQNVFFECLPQWMQSLHYILYTDSVSYDFNDLEKSFPKIRHYLEEHNLLESISQRLTSWNDRWRWLTLLVNHRHYDNVINLLKDLDDDHFKYFLYATFAPQSIIHNIIAPLISDDDKIMIDDEIRKVDTECELLYGKKTLSLRRKVWLSRRENIPQYSEMELI